MGNLINKDFKLLAWSKRIPLEDIIQYYEVENHTYEECTDHFLIGTEMFFRLLKYYNYNKPIEQHLELTRKTNMEKYGTPNAMQNHEIRSKQAKKAKESNLEKQFKEFLLSKNIKFEHPYTLKKEKGAIHAFDFAIFKNNKLDALVDCDGIYYHSYITDVGGDRATSYTDIYRQEIVPENVKFCVLIELNEDIDYPEFLKIYNMDFEKYKNYLNLRYKRPQDILPRYTDKILKNSLKYLKVTNYGYNKNITAGVKIIENFHKSLWDPIITNIQDKNRLKKLIDNNIIYYIDQQGNFKLLEAITRHFNLNVDIFNPYLAKYIVEKYLNNYDVIFDPCSGYSGRMLGTCSLNKKYIGQDINPIIVEESNNIIAYFNLNAKVKVKNLLEDSGNYPCLFTCTPYKNKENWGQEIENKSCDDWITECLNRYKCEKYVFVVDETEKYKEFIVEEIINKSHFGQNKEYILLIENKK